MKPLSSPKLELVVEDFDGLEVLTDLDPVAAVAMETLGPVATPGVWVLQPQELVPALGAPGCDQLVHRVLAASRAARNRSTVIPGHALSTRAQATDWGIPDSSRLSSMTKRPG